MLNLVRQHLTTGLAHTGLPERFIRQEQRSRGEAFPTDLSAYLYPLQGSLERAGKRLSITPPPGRRTRRWLWLGSARMRCELYARHENELNQILQGFLTWLFDNTFVDASGVRFSIPAETIGFTYQDEEGVLISQNGIWLEIPVEIGIYRDINWIPISVHLEYEIEGGASGE
ncbi:hypothetical protein [uncultured Meiothermus sp.]|uniref:hypothetical protein n=1 Tax=uncultured Meiothermus sp. TaxID=157471 RepID=UPI0026332409|nr:hypothetical protein [uncultured Meiothermus sp.]